jgi:hypothetical protein
MHLSFPKGFDSDHFLIPRHTLEVGGAGVIVPIFQSRNLEFGQVK